MEVVEKVHKKKRKREELDKSEESGSSKSDRDIKHRSKRVHQSSSDGDSMALSAADHHEEMLDTVSGHIQELEIKENDMDGDSSKARKHTKAVAQSKKKRTESSELNENGGERTSFGDDVGASAQMEDKTDILSSGVSQESALDYLRLWKEERERWSFKKKTQYWLLQNMYDRTKVPKSGFKIMLRYLAGLQGRQRELSVQKAQKIVDQYGEEGSSTSRRHYKRAVAIMRVLG